MQWNRESPEQYPLPAALPSFSEEPKDGYCQARLPTNINEAAENLWNSQQSVIELMLKLYHMRPKGGNEIQHPAPLSMSAFEFIQSNSNITEQEKPTARLVVETATRWDSSGEILLFTQTCPLGASRGTIRQRGVDGGGVHAKKQRRGEYKHLEG